MKPIRALLDLDGVVRNFLDPCLKIINRMLGSNHALDEMTTWDIFESFKVPQVIVDAVYEEMSVSGWCSTLEPYPGAAEGVKLLQEIAELYIVTAPLDAPTWTHETEKWVQEHFGIPRKHVVPCDVKFICAADFIIDDKTQTLERWQSCYPEGMAIRWRQMTNRNVPFNGVTVGDWETLRDIMKHRGSYVDWDRRAWRHR